MALLRAVCAHHYGPHAIKAMLLAAANLCYNEVVPVTQKCDLREHLSSGGVLQKARDGVASGVASGVVKYA